MSIAMTQAIGEEIETRSPVALTATEKAFVLGQMRLFVESVERIVTALALGDAAAAAEAAAARGARRFQAENIMPATLSEKLPEQWRQFGRPMRAGFDALAQGVANGEDRNRSFARLGDVMRNCVGCHAAYRIVDAQN
ncbi:hypothetical protein V3H18_08825 [Methylocystis sp. 9N]|uniref:Cytochrome c n=1 Tax=Methylocystis borbori TaxID=3118750 RepID=A0ABU7XGW7_9HYPH